jgi:pyruvate formate lyase activating enzyme
VNIYHITHSPQVGIAHLYFWGCNLNCRACLRKKELYDSHLAEIKGGIFSPARKGTGAPEHFLSHEEAMRIIGELEVKQVVLMGAEPTTDSELSQLTEALHRELSSHNILLTNGFILADLNHIDEVVFSIKAYSDRLHRDYTGKSNRKVLENFARYYQSGVKLRAESIFIPDYIDYHEIESISRFIARIDQNIPYRIDAYIPVGDNPWRRPTPEEMQKAVDIARKHLASVSCLTGKERLKSELLRVI